MKQTNVIKISLIFFLASVTACPTYTMQKLIKNNIFEAVRKNDIALVKEIINKDKSTVNERCEDGLTLLHYAALFMNPATFTVHIGRGLSVFSLSSSILY